MSYFIYARKSRKDADLEALGIDVLERHITTLLELAKTLSLPIGAIYREVVSGDSIDSRPVMSQVMAEVESCMWDGCLWTLTASPAEIRSIKGGYSVHFSTQTQRSLLLTRRMIRQTSTITNTLNLVCL